MSWPVSARDHGTFCISCHTALPYALSRPALRSALHEEAPTGNEQRLLDNVTKRVRLWKDVEPYYNDHADGKNKSNEARGTEAVLNALILASHDARNGTLSNDTRLALNNMWSLQQTTGDLNGAWWWIQFGNEPFEAHDSKYYGAALAAVAAGTAGETYRAQPEVQQHLKSLQEYLNREYGQQSPINHAVLLWASAKWPGLLTSEQQNSIISDLVNLQRADGGWNLAALAWTWTDWNSPSMLRTLTRSYGSPLRGYSDGYATALITFALEQAGVRRDNVHLSRALAWLERNQNKTEGQWQSYSLNNRRDPESATGRFMSDAATGYAVLALTNN
jgi:squalene-hopene/tetraprenyl-beta-curcumene cyclase